MKTLVYVDAENINYDEAEPYLMKIKEESKEADLVVGKFYGARDVIDPSLVSYLKIGLEYVDTASIITGRKNVADMKIVVDCVFDVFQKFINDVRKVYLFTRDCDFLPLVYKLSGLNIEVETPLFEINRIPRSKSEINEKLKEIEYTPMLTDEWMYPQIEHVQYLLQDAVDFGALAEFYEKKRVKFVRDLKPILENDQFIKQINALPVLNFGIVPVVHHLCSKGVTREDLEKVLTAYTKKYFGATFNSSIIQSKLSQIL